MKVHRKVEVRFVLYIKYMQSDYSTRKTTGLEVIIVSSIAMQLQFLQPIIL